MGLFTAENATMSGGLLKPKFVHLVRTQTMSMIYSLVANFSSSTVSFFTCCDKSGLGFSRDALQFKREDFPHPSVDGKCSQLKYEDALHMNLNLLKQMNYCSLSFSHVYIVTSMLWTETTCSSSSHHDNTGVGRLDFSYIFYQYSTHRVIYCFIWLH